MAVKVPEELVLGPLQPATKAAGEPPSPFSLDDLFGWLFARTQTAAQGGGRRGPSRGQLQDAAASLKDLADEYLVPMSTPTLNKWASRIAAGGVGASAFEDYIKQQAKSMYPTIAAAIDQGTTTRQFFDPYIERAAELLEISPESIDLKDGKYREFLSVTDPNGNKTHMSIVDWEKHVRTQPQYGWRYTDNANELATNMAIAIRRMFGNEA